MLDRFLGGYVTASPTAPTQTSAQGVWELEQQASAQVQNAWPLPPNVIQRSLRFNRADSAYLVRTMSSASSTYTLSMWVKRGVITTAPWQYLFSSGNNGLAFDQSTDKLYYYESGIGQQLSTAVFRDPSAWYHIVLSVNALAFTAYVNNSSVVTGTAAALSTTASATAIGRYYNSGSGQNYFDGYMTEINFVDGQALTPSSFGETDPQTGVWIPKVYTGSYGTNGFRLRFNNNSSTTALGYDTSGNGNNWTPNNFSVTAGSGNDSMLDVPSLYGTDTGLGGEVRGNYCTLNPLDNGGITLSNGNLDATRSTATTAATRCTFAVSSGKWYWEVTPTALGALTVGIGTQSASLSGIVGGDAFGYGWYNDSGGTSSKYNNNVSSSYGTALSAGVTCGVALDLDAGTITFYRNGVSQGVAYSGITAGTYFPMISQWGGTTSTANLNFGQRPFAYTAPSGFKALCTTNLSAPSIGQTSTNQADNFFQATVYTGNGNTSPGQLVSLDFQPDFVWIKERTSTEWHQLYDALRTTNALFSNNADAQVSLDGVTLTSSGFYAKDAFRTNENTAPYVAWSWNAGGSTVTNTQGTITSSVRANPASGFSVVTFTGSATNNSVGHGLGITPSFVIVKSATEVSSWVVYHSSLVSNGLLILNSTAAVDTTIPNYWGSGMTSSVIGVYAGGSGANNRTGQTMIAYCFAAIPGFSAFGSYTGNASTDGPFVYLGFRPRFVMIKSTSAGTEWVMMDTSRSPYNLAEAALYANRDYSESTIGAVNDLDLLSNGFKLRNTTGFVNASQTYIYAAFAEYPFRLALAR